MKKKLLLSSGILVLASPFISATCIVRNKSENDNPAASPAPNPVTPPTTEPVTPPNTPPNTPPSVQPAPNPVTPPTTEPVTPPNTTPADQPAPNPGTNPNTEPILPNTTPVTPAPAKKDIKAEWNNIFRDSPTGADIFWHPSKEQLEKERFKKHEYASSESTLRLFDDTYTDAKNKALLEKAKRDVAKSNDSVLRNSSSIEKGNWIGISKDKEEKLRKQLTDISESILNNDPDEWERKEEAKKAWEAALSKVPFWDDINSKGLKEEYKDSLDRKHKLLLDYFKKLEDKNNKEINLTIESNNSYLNLLKAHLEDDKKSLEKQKNDNDNKLLSISKELENKDKKEKLSEVKKLIEELSELLAFSKDNFGKYSDNISYVEWLTNFGLKLRSEKDIEQKELQRLTEELEKYKSSKTEENKISEIDKKYKTDVKNINELLDSEKTNKLNSEKSLKEYKEDLNYYDKYNLYLTYNPKDSFEEYLDKITEYSENIEIYKSEITELEKLKIKIESERNRLISEAKAETHHKEKEVQDHKSRLETLTNDDDKISAELSRKNDEYISNKNEIEDINKDIKNLDSLISYYLYSEKILSSEISKLEEEKKSLEAKSKEISDNLAKLDEKEELIAELEKMYEDQVEKLEEIAHNSEKDLNEYIKKVEKELKGLN
ncbi:lipoprotein, MAG6090 family [Mycoplasmopsis agalactiae]|uniref:lipoprotein, MAG6090 family n=1 Tax=Mycoplasmopsis agalactiae TaxID=2110 RepID=UPI001F30B84A|nr:hypothetical protein [Mycoplasmopsis agalactiae]MCE6115443.1 hypothetical protein [Mycoplasmopsis agalactiae]